MAAKFGKAIIAGAARNVGKYLPDTLRNMERIGELFETANFVFFENDSTDDTLIQLQSWGKGRECHVLTMQNLGPHFSSRSQLVAYCRNQLIACALQYYGDAEYFIMLDMDEVNRFVHIEGVWRAVEYLAERKTLAGVFANSLPDYYDIWALRHDKWCNRDCVWDYLTDVKKGMPKEEAHFRHIDSRKGYLPPSRPPITVRSAFGGLGIYKMAVLSTSRFEGAAPDGKEMCEHVSFNLGVLGKTGSGFAIFPALVNSPYSWMRLLVRRPGRLTELVCKLATYLKTRRYPRTILY